MQNALHCIVAMLVVQSCYGWDFTSNLDGWTDSKGSKKKHLESPGSYQFGRRHATIIFEDREHAWKNASIWLRKHVSFKMSHNLRGFSWILLGAGSARHHKEPFFFFRVWDLFILWGLKGCCSLFLEFCTLRGLAPNLRWNVMPNQKDSVWSVGSSYEINWDVDQSRTERFSLARKKTVNLCSWSSWACTSHKGARSSFWCVSVSWKNIWVL